MCLNVAVHKHKHIVYSCTMSKNFENERAKKDQNHVLRVILMGN